MSARRTVLLCVATDASTFRAPTCVSVIRVLYLSQMAAAVRHQVCPVGLSEIYCNTMYMQVDVSSAQKII